MRRNQKVSLAILAVIAMLTVSSAQSPQAGASSGANSDVASGAAGNLEILSDTRGFDFKPYLSKLLGRIRTNWFNLIPQEARPPQLATGVTSIEFAIFPTGQIRGMKLVHQSGNLSLDRAAWGGITACVPLQPLPKQFKGEFLALRMHVYYNPKKLPPTEQPIPPPAQPNTETPETH